MRYHKNKMQNLLEDDRREGHSVKFAGKAPARQHSANVGSKGTR